MNFVVVYVEVLFLTVAGYRLVDAAVQYVSHRQCNDVPRGTFIAHPSNCHQFVQCNGLRSILGECPAGTFFNSAVLSCGSSRHSCASKNTESGPELPEEAHLSAAVELLEQPNGEAAATTVTTPSTTSTPTPTTVIPTLMVLPTRRPAVLMTTEKPIFAASGNSLLASGGLPKPPQVSGGVASVLTNFGRPICTVWFDQQLPHPLNCEYYYKCVRGFLTVRRCYFGFGWDMGRQRCLPLREATCYRRYIHTLA